MQVMTLHQWYDNDVEHVRMDLEDTREIVLNEANEGSFLISEDDVIELAKEFGLVVYRKNANL